VGSGWGEWVSAASLSKRARLVIPVGATIYSIALLRGWGGLL
jgi:hypothetical protein